MEEISESLGIVNPLEAVIDTLEELQESLSEFSLSNERLPTFDNPFKTPLISGALQTLINPNIQIMNLNNHIVIYSI